MGRVTRRGAALVGAALVCGLMVPVASLATGTPTAGGVAGPDNNVAWDGLRHDSRDTLYRTPGGAVPEGTPVTLRMRTFHDDVTGVRVRTYSVNDAAQTILPMTRVAADVELLPVRPLRQVLRLLAGDPRQRRPGLDLVPVPRHRRHQDRVLLRRHPRARRRAGRAQRRSRRQQLGVERLRAIVQVPRVGQGRRHLPGVPRPLPQRLQGQRSADRRHPLRRPRAGADLGDPARGLLPRLRRCVRRQLPVASRPACRGHQRRGAAARARLSGRGPGRTGSQARPPQGPGGHSRVSEPDLRRGFQPQLRHPGLHEGGPVLRHPEGLRHPRGARQPEGDPDHPRRRVQPHVQRQPVLRPVSPLRDGRRMRVGVVAVPVVVHLPQADRRRTPGRVCALHAGRRGHVLRRLVRVRLDPGADQVGRGRAEVLPHLQGLDRQALAARREPPAGGWT